MNSIAFRWAGDVLEDTQHETRFDRHAREALDRMVERDGARHSAQAERLVETLARTDASVAAAHAAIRARRHQLQQRAQRLAAVGAMSAGLISLLVMAMPIAAAGQALLLVATGVAAGLFFLVGRPWAPALPFQMMAQLFLTLMLVSQAGSLPLGLGVATLGWAAIYARAWVEARGRTLDLDQMHLVLKMRESGTRAQARLQRAAAI